MRSLIRAMLSEWLMQDGVPLGGLKSLCLDSGRKKKSAQEAQAQDDA